MTDLSIIIVNWNVADLLAACLRSIDASRGDLTLEVIIVDSASSDNSVVMLHSDFPWVRLMAQTENVGFTRGNNLALEVAEGRHLLLLNPDTEVIGDMLPTMVRYLDDNPKVGIVGPHTYNTDQTTQPSKRRLPTAAVAFFESTWLQPYAPRKLLDAFYVNDVADDETAPVGWVQGHALMARREVYDQIGGLDEGFVMFFEELDWCKRASEAGWGVTYLGSAHVVHHGGQSTAQVGARKHILFNQSKLRYFRKHHGAALGATLHAFLLMSYGWQLVLEVAKGLLGHKRDLRRERVTAYWQVLRSGLR